MTQILGNNEPFPSRDPITVPSTGMATDVFKRWNEQALMPQIQASPRRTQSATQETNKSATATGTLGGDEAAGLYRVSAMLAVITPEAASQVELTLAWTYGGTARTHVFADVLDGSALANEQGFVYAIQIDSGTPISYTLTYTGATLVYNATLSAELLEGIG